MNVWDALIIAAVAVALGLALRQVIRSRGTCHCDGDCSKCGKARRDGRKAE